MNLLELYHLLPDEMKKIILDKLPIEYLVDKTSTKVNDIVDEYITEYIEKNI